MINMHIARINKTTGLVENIEVWADLPAETDQHLFVESDEAGIGWTLGGSGFDAPSVPFEAAKSAKKAALMAHRDAIFNDGYTVESGTMAGHVLQTRTFGEDRTNWLTSQASYKAAIDAGHGAVEGANFRTKANLNFTVSFDEGHSVILAMVAWGALVVARAWVLSDLVSAAEDQAELDAIDITTGWPD